MPSSLYIHIPFCKQICPYCDFPKLFYREDWAFSYLNELFKEAKSSLKGQYETIYIGGGTPSCLKEEELISLLSFFSPYLKQGGEFSIEGNPESISKEKAKIMASFGVNRVSLGVQSSNPEFLSLLGRGHSYDDVKRAYSFLKEAGIDNLNADMMFALPGQNKLEAKEDAMAILSLPITHFSSYSLILEPSTLFFKKGIKEASQEEQAEQYEEVKKAAESKGFARYEVSSYAKDEFRCRHNLAYWKDEEYVGLGLGAAGYEAGVRYKNTSSLFDYLNGKRHVEEEIVGKKEDVAYFLLTNLRLEEGFGIASFRKRFGNEELDSLLSKCRPLENKGLIEIKEGHIRMNKQKLILLDNALVSLI